MGAIGIGVGIFLFINNAVLLAAISAFIGIFGALILELHLVLYSFLALRHEMHPKYVFAKKELDCDLPFDPKKKGQED